MKGVIQQIQERLEILSDLSGIEWFVRLEKNGFMVLEKYISEELPLVNNECKTHKEVLNGLDWYISEYKSGNFKKFSNE